MGLFGFKITRTKKSKPSPRSGYGFDEVDLDHATQVRRLRAERKRLEHELQKIEMEREIALKRAELQDLEDELFNNDDDDEETGSSLEDQAMQMLLSRFLGGQPQNNSPIVPENSPANEPPAQISDEDIQEMINSLPKKYVLAAKIMPDEKLKNVLLQKGLSPDVCDRAIKMFRGGSSE